MEIDCANTAQMVLMAFSHTLGDVIKTLGDDKQVQYRFLHGVFECRSVQCTIKSYNLPHALVSVKTLTVRSPILINIINPTYVFFQSLYVKKYCLKIHLSDSPIWLESLSMLSSSVLY